MSLLSWTTGSKEAPVSQQKSEFAFGLLPKKSASPAVPLRWRADLETVDRRLRELEDHFIEEALGEVRPEPNPNHPWRDRV